MARRALALDANLLVLLVVGATDKSLLRRHKRVREFLETDFELLAGFISRFERLVVTPNVLTEASNLIGQIDGKTSQRLRGELERLIGQVDERYVRSIDAVTRPEFIQLGLTDSVILSEAMNDALLLTTDWRLCAEAARTNRDAINFNHLRETDWKS